MNLLVLQLDLRVTATLCPSSGTIPALFDVGGYLVNWSMGLPVPEARYYRGFPSWHLASVHHSSCATTHACVHEHM